MLLTKESRKQQSQVVDYRKLDIYKYSIIVICLIASIWFIGFRRSAIGYIASGGFLMYIPYVWYEVSALKFKLNVRKHLKGTMKGNEDIADNLDKLDKMYTKQVDRNSELMDNLDWCFGVIRQLTDEVKPLKVNVTNKHNVKMTLIEAEKIKIQYEGKTDYATPISMGMVDARKKTTLYWGYIASFCQYNGKVDFPLIMSQRNQDYYAESNKIYQQLNRFRVSLGEFLGTKIDKSDYTFKKGVFTWKSIIWSDEFTTHQEKLAIEESLGRAEGHKEARFQKKVRTGEYNFKTGERQVFCKDGEDIEGIEVVDYNEIPRDQNDNYNPSYTESFDADD